MAIIQTKIANFIIANLWLKALTVSCTSIYGHACMYAYNIQLQETACMYV